MATTNHKVFATYPIVKMEERPEGLVVYGKATDGSVDTDQQIVDPEWSSKALGKWLDSGGNVRVQHNPKLYPAGKGLAVELDRDGDGGHWVKALIVEDTAQKLVKAGVLTAYSVGISRPVIKRDITGKARGGIICGGDDTEIAEISLVDRPANRNCSITLVKGAGMDGDWSTGDLEALLEKAEDKKDELVDALAALPDAKDAPDDDDAEDQEDDDFSDDVEDDDDADDDDDDVQKSAWQAECAAWLDREPRPASDAPHTGTAFLAKRAEWERWHTEGQDNGLENVPDAYDRWLAKRDMDPNVGGGVDRDKIPSKNFIDPKGRRFPIVKPGDVSDAVHSYGQADPLIPMDVFRKRLKAIAHRLGEAFVAELPESWDNNDMGKGKKKKDKEMSMSPLPADVKPAGPHREPDGDEVQALEADADMHINPDPVHDKIPASVKTSDYQLKRMHDALCAAYDWDTVAAEYPSLKGVSDAVVPAFFHTEVQTSAAKGDMQTVTSLAGLALLAEGIHKGVHDPAAVADGRAGLHKGFEGMYPNVRVSPGSISPGQFQRPYLSVGHIPASAPADRASNVPPPSRVPDANDFDRPLIVAGHEAEAPGDRGDNLRTTSVSSGAARQYYSNAAKDAARVAMQAMHDHISQTFPDMCPMAPSQDVMPADMGDINVPHPVEPMELPKSPGEKATTPEATKTKSLGKKKLAEIIKTAVTEATRDIQTGYETHITALKNSHETQISAMQAQIDHLGAQPDPTQAPMRGVVAVRKAATTTDEPAPIERTSFVEKAQAQVAADREEQVRFAAQFLNHPDPARREQAEAYLRRILATP